METTIRIYISGAITGIKDYEKKFMDAEKYLSRDCIHIENPVRIGSGLKNPTYEDYMRADLKALLTCDEIYMLHGWSESKGACFELDTAKMCGIKIRYQDEEDKQEY